MLVDLLDASRLGAGRGLALELHDCDLVQLAREVAADFTAQHGARFVVTAETKVTGFWNADALRRILENLVSNAVKYGDRTTPITIRLRARDDRRIVFVHNFGPTIEMTDQAELFRPFHRARTAEASAQTGWGLGLALVRGLVEALRGEVMLASYPNEGTTFTVDLPADPRKCPAPGNR
jgi:signal transduction histidine kinase